MPLPLHSFASPCQAGHFERRQCCLGSKSSRQSTPPADQRQRESDSTRGGSYAPQGGEGLRFLRFLKEITKLLLQLIMTVDVDQS